MVVLDCGRREGFEAVVDLSTDAVVDVQPINGPGQPPITPDECEEAEEAVKRDARYRQALERRGIRDMARVCVDGGVGKYVHTDQRSPM